jgi:cytidine diphosphoramidate kinase
VTASGACGAVIWVTGLSGVGKTTVARLVTLKLRAQGRSVIHLDGDDIRRTLPEEWVGFTKKERLALAHHYVGLTHLFYDQGFTVVISTVSLFYEIHARNRELFQRYLQVVLSAPMEVLRQRDIREVYSSPVDRPIVGIDIPSEVPAGADVLYLENYGDVSPERCTEAILLAFSTASWASDCDTTHITLGL